MAQISLPFRIALIAFALFGAVWFAALRPKADTAADAPLPAAPGVTGLTNATAKAQSAVKASQASAERSEAAAKAAEAASTAPAAAEAAKATAAKPGVTAAASRSAAAKARAGNPAAPLLSALDRGRVVVLLFRNRSSDSADVARMVRSIGERRKVVARVAPIRDVGRYQTFTGTTQVSQAPTTLVIGPRRNAKVIVGFTSTGEIAQAVADVRRSGDKQS